MPRLVPNEDRIARWSRDLLKHTPWKTESLNEERARRERHRALPRDDQPYMVVVFGMLSYGVLWIGDDGGVGHVSDHDRKQVAEREATWWRDQIRGGLEMIPFTRNPLPHDIQVRQQWDLDALACAILDSYRYD
jgi:hypothetical protein